MSQAHFPFPDDPENSGPYRSDRPPPPKDRRGRKHRQPWRITTEGPTGDPEYLARQTAPGRGGTPAHIWTTNPDGALRFATQEDARTFAEANTRERYRLTDD